MNPHPPHPNHRLPFLSALSPRRWLLILGSLCIVSGVFWSGIWNHKELGNSLEVYQEMFKEVGLLPILLFFRDIILGVFMVLLALWGSNSVFALWLRRAALALAALCLVFQYSSFYGTLKTSLTAHRATVVVPKEYKGWIAIHVSHPVHPGWFTRPTTYRYNIPPDGFLPVESGWIPQSHLHHKFEPKGPNKGASAPAPDCVQLVWEDGTPLKFTEFAAPWPFPDLIPARLPRQLLIYKIAPSKDDLRAVGMPDLSENRPAGFDYESYRKASDEVDKARNSFEEQAAMFVYDKYPNLLPSIHDRAALGFYQRLPNLRAKAESLQRTAPSPGHP